jgi:GT2 family glycosyltransferase
MKPNENVRVVVLNYNNYEDTINLSYDLIQQKNVNLDIVIVDNCSTDNSLKILNENLNFPNISIIRSEKNGGYAYGNNYGLNYINEADNKYAAILNPDIRIQDNNLFNKLIYRYKTLTNPGFIAPASIDDAGNINNYCAKKVPTFNHEIFSSFLIFSKFISNLNTYPLNKTDKKNLNVEMLSGSFLFINFDLLRAIEFFDEGTFLFCEERILSHKIKGIKANNYLLRDMFIKHNASTTIGSLYTNTEQLSILHKSLLYYIKNYLPNGKIKCIVIFPFLKLKVLQMKILNFLN